MPASSISGTFVFVLHFVAIACSLFVLETRGGAGHCPGRSTACSARLTLDFLISAWGIAWCAPGR